MPRTARLDFFCIIRTRIRPAQGNHQRLSAFCQARRRMMLPTPLRICETFSAQHRDVPLSGAFDPRYERVVEAFKENYRIEDEVGSGLHIIRNGQSVVDLWGGWRDGGRTREWQRDTIVCVMSVSKGIAGIAFNMLIDRGLIDVDLPVAYYWPEFRAGGKERLPVRYVLDHRAGLPIVAAPLWPGAIFDRDAMVNALAAQEPLWEPGTTAAYHVTTQGFLLGEIMRRVTGQTFQTFISQEIAGPLRADFQIGGLALRDQARCAELLPNLEARLLAAKDEAPDSLRARTMLQYPKEPWSVLLNSKAWRVAEIASGNGHGTACGIAAIYGVIAAGGEWQGRRFMHAASMENMLREQHHQIEVIQDRHYHQGLGLLLNSPDAVYMGPNPRAFGHHGIGGSIGFGDPDAHIGFSYVVNRFHAVGTNGPRARRLIDALYDCL
jgi:CubicO group peptidase (beta-lactamase class C family)